MSATEETTLLMVYLVFLASANYHAFGDEAGTDDPLADTLDDQAHAYSQRKSIEIALSYVKTSRKLVQQLGREIDELKNVVDVDPETGARTITRDEDAVPTAQDLEDGLARAFGPSRAAAVSVTQTTDAQSVGGDAGIAATVGLSDGDIWITETDERVCVICEPLHLMARRVWRAQYPTGPPAHVNCRCIVGYENGSRSELGADVA